MDFINAAIRANQELSRFVNNGLKNEMFEHFGIGAGGDKSSKIDLVAEEFFIKHLTEYGQIISEECGIYGEGEDKIILDPIDGSDNLLSKLPYYGTSVSLKKRGKVVCAVIVNLANLDIFVKNEKFFKYAKLNKLDFVDVKEHKFSTLGVFERAYCSDLYVKKLKKAKIKYRSPGAMALSLAYASNLKFVMYEGQIREYDVSAGFYMCEGMSIYRNENFFLVSKDKKVFEEFKNILELEV